MVVVMMIVIVVHRSRLLRLDRHGNRLCGLSPGETSCYICFRLSNGETSDPILKVASHRYNPFRQMSESKDQSQVYDSRGTLNLTFANARNTRWDANVKFVPLA